MLELYIKGQELRVTQPRVVADSINYLEVHGHFLGDDWSGLHKYLHIFKKGAEKYEFIMINDSVELGLNFFTPGDWSIWVHGTEYSGEEIVKRITTNVVQIRVTESGAIEGEFFPSIAPNIAEQLIAKAENLLERVDAIDVAAIEAAGEKALEDIGEAQEQALQEIEEKVPKDYAALIDAVETMKSDISGMVGAIADLFGAVAIWDSEKIEAPAEKIEALRDYASGGIRAKFAGGTLTITGVRLITRAAFSGGVLTLR